MATQTPATAQTDRTDGDGGPRTVSLDADRQIAYATYGPPDGTPVVFLHGTPGSRRLGELFESAARDHGVRLLAPDRPGYGRSSPWAGRSVVDGATVVTTVLDDAGIERAGLVAFSGGAPHALATAATFPERVARVDVIAGATPPDAGDDPIVQRLLQGLATSVPRLLGGLFRGQAWLADRLDPSVVLAQYTDDTESVPSAVAEVVRADFLEAFARHRSGAVTEFRLAAADWGLPFATIEPPVCFRHGEADTNVPMAGLRALAERIPGAGVETLAEADHLGTLLRSRGPVLARHG